MRIRRCRRGSVLCGILSADTGGIERRGRAQISYACPHVSRAAASSQRLTAAMCVSIMDRQSLQVIALASRQLGMGAVVQIPIDRRHPPPVRGLRDVRAHSATAALGTVLRSNSDECSCGRKGSLMLASQYSSSASGARCEGSNPSGGIPFLISRFCHLPRRSALSRACSGMTSGDTAGHRMTRSDRLRAPGSRPRSPSPRVSPAQ